METLFNSKPSNRKRTSELRSLTSALDATIAKIEAIKKLSAHTKDYIQAALPSIYSHELVTLLFEQPYARILSLEKAGIAKRQTASRYLQALTEIGVLNEIHIGRDKLFIHPKLMDLLSGDNNQFTAYRRIA